jgi:septal ring factor EnvC (AmiA/AmiB activator)
LSKSERKGRILVVAKVSNWIIVSLILVCAVLGWQSHDRGIRLKQALGDIREARIAQSAAIKRLESLQGKLDTANERIKQLQKRLSGTIGTIGTIENRLDSAQHSVAESGKLIKEQRRILEKIKQGD